MSNISEFNNASNAETDREHEVQIGLLQALCGAAAENRDAAAHIDTRDRRFADYVRNGL